MHLLVVMLVESVYGDCTEPFAQIPCHFLNTHIHAHKKKDMKDLQKKRDNRVEKTTTIKKKKNRAQRKCIL